MWFFIFVKIMPSLAAAELKEALNPPMRSAQHE